MWTIGNGDSNRGATLRADRERMRVGEAPVAEIVVLLDADGVAVGPGVTPIRTRVELRSRVEVDASNASGSLTAGSVYTSTRRSPIACAAAWSR
jgi:hypothetical protein